jgi:hypothetical protein
VNVLDFRDEDIFLGGKNAGLPVVILMIFDNRMEEA